MAFLYYSVAARLESDSARMKLGECFRNGYGTEQDLRRAVQYFEQASKGNKEALVCLG
jgi:TPR repeat protein